VKHKVGNSLLYIACAYFPGEGQDANLTNELYNQLLAEIIKIQDASESEDPYIVIMGDFNARIGDNIKFGDPVINNNGRRFLEFKNDSDLTIVNCTRKCYGKITWFRHPNSSTIDYFLVSDSMYNFINEMIVDEDRKFNIGRDYNMLFLNMTLCINPIKEKEINRKLIWDIKKNHDFTDYRNEIKVQFNNWSVNSFDEPDSMWSDWKTKLLFAANKTIGVKRSNCKPKQWWDKSIDDARALKR
jgi:hypothetical protein